jgi:acyl carrier protein
MDISAALIDYIQKDLAIGRSKPIRPDENLFSTGVLDSIAVMQLVVFIEERFGVKVPDEDVALENFQSVSAIASYLERRRDGRASTETDRP